VPVSFAYFLPFVALRHCFDLPNHTMQITPSSSQTYSATAIQNAIIAGTTYTADLVCTDGALSSVQFYLNAQGPLQDGVFVQGACVLSFCLFAEAGLKTNVGRPVRQAARRKSLGRRRRSVRAHCGTSCEREARSKQKGTGIVEDDREVYFVCRRYTANFST
jgi:hypothetical protein